MINLCKLKHEYKKTFRKEIIYEIAEYIIKPPLIIIKP